MTIGSPPPAASSRLRHKKIPIKSSATTFAVRRYSLPQGFPARARGSFPPPPHGGSIQFTWRRSLFCGPMIGKRLRVYRRTLLLSDEADRSLLDSHGPRFVAVPRKLGAGAASCHYNIHRNLRGINTRVDMQLLAIRYR